MLIEFSVENWMSFKDKAVFSMVANNRLTKQKAHLACFPEYKLNVLPTAVMYGANGSGKTAFVKAIAFIKLFILEGNDRNDSILVRPFRLSKDTQNAPSEFSITFFTTHACYEFSFSATKDTILKEELSLITPSKDCQIYMRSGQDVQTQKGSPVEGMEKYVKEKQLFLTTALRNNQFPDIQIWFDFILTPLGTSSGFRSFREFTREDSFVREGVNRLLSTLGTGVEELSSIPLSEKQIRSIFEHLPPEGETFAKRDPLTAERVFCYFQDGQLHGEQLVTNHLDDDGDKVTFSIAKDESDGTRRLIDLLPAFVEHEKNDIPRVFIIDELERSLHTNITMTLLKFFLHNCSQENRTQLIFTTHDTMLMDLDIFRRDEIWMAEKINSQSKLFSLNDYKVRADKDVQKDYLRGLYGGTPTILLERLLKG